jgi:hypothetical protein
MAKKTLEQKIDSLTSIVEKGFAASDKKFGALAEDVADIRETMTTKDQVLALQTQVNSIETQLRGMKHTKLHARVADLEDWDRKALGSRVLFHFPAEIGYRFDERNSLSVYFEHTSNGYTVHPNEGLDRLGIRYGYRF